MKDQINSHDMKLIREKLQNTSNQSNFSIFSNHKSSLACAHNCPFDSELAVEILINPRDNTGFIN